MPKRRKTAMDAWLESLDEDEDAGKEVLDEIADAEDKALTTWVEANPTGDLDDNRLQLVRSAKRRVFEEKCAKDPALYATCLKAAEDAKSKQSTISSADRCVKCCSFLTSS